MGEFVSLNMRKVYSFYDRSLNGSDETIQAGDHLHIGLDFNIGGTCAVVFIERGEETLAVMEFVSNDTADFINNLYIYSDHKITIYPDASGKNSHTNAAASDIDLIENAANVRGVDWYIDAPNANPFIRDRVNAKNALLSKRTLKVNDEKCPNYARSLETQGYTVKGDPEKYDSHPSIDDWGDAGGYFVHRKHPISKPATLIKVRF